MAYLRTTNGVTVLGAEVNGFPLIISSRLLVDWVALEFFIELHRTGVAVSSIRTYATHLVDFLSQLETDERGIGDVTDEWLEAYRAAILSRKNALGNPNSSNYASQVLRSTVHYLHWLEVNQYVRGIVGAGKGNKVRVIETKRGIWHRTSRWKAQNGAKPATPRTEWIDAVRRHGPAQDDVALRFDLMIDWCKALGLRAMEVCAITINQLPDLTTAEKSILEKKHVYMRLSKTKGGKIATVPVAPLLIKETWDYISAERSALLRRFRKRYMRAGRQFEEPKEVFLSHKTGGPITPRALSNSIRRSFLRAVAAGELARDERVWLHGLRHNFTVSLLRELDQKRVRRPEAIARQVTRHGSDGAMEPYLTDRFNDDFNG